MYSFAELQREISKVIDQKRALKEKLHPSWITTAIMESHSDITGVDADFHKCCSRVSIRKEVTQQVNRIDADPANPSQQLILDGFDHLQSYYVVERDGELVGVPVDEVSNAELLRKADEYDAMGRACMKHADEIRRYVSNRKIAA